MNVQQYVEQLQTDPELARMARELAAREPATAIERLADIGRERGFDVDAQRLEKTLVSKAEVAQELDDSDLEHVSGGIIAILIGLVSGPHRGPLRGREVTNP